MKKIIIISIFVMFFQACSQININRFFYDEGLNKASKSELIQKSKIKNENKKEVEKKPIINKPIPIKPSLKEPTPVKKEELKEEIYKKIAFIGDSHLASDYMPMYFRKALNIKSLGFFPASLPKWHNQYLLSYKNLNTNTKFIINTKENLSFAGINTECLKACNIDIKLSFLADKIDMIFYKDSKWQIKQISQRTNIIKLSEENTIIGGFLSNNAKYIDNLGVNGASIYNYLRINDELAKKIAKKLNYDLVIFSFGTNESVSDRINEDIFIQKYQKIIDIFKAKNTKILLLIPPEPVIYKNKNYEKGKNNALVKELIQKIAKQNNALIFDIDELMQKEGGKAAWIADKKSLKNTHLSKQGYDYVALKLLEFLKITKD